MKTTDQVHREREVAVLEAAAAIADMTRYGGDLPYGDEAVKLRLEQLRLAVFRLRDTCGAGPLRVTLGDLARRKP